MKSSTVFIRSLAISSSALGFATLVAEPPNPLFVPVTSRVVAEVGDSPGAAWGDLDNEGWPDLVVSRSRGAPRVCRNLGDGQLALVPGARAEAGGDGHGVSLGDFDNDGWLDVLLAKRNGRPRQVFGNSGNLAFELPGLTAVPGFAGDAVGAARGDYDREDYLDAFLTDLSGVNRLWRNLGGASSAQLEAGAVAAAAWDWNGHAMGPRALVEGRFNVTGIRLLAGENRLKVTARDASGNTSAEEVVVTWQPLRVFGLGQVDATQEGRRCDVPVILNSGGDVGGLSFEVRYDPEWLRAPAGSFTDVLAGALAEVNTDTPGTVRVTLSRAGTGIAAGEHVLANLSFRARSVPEATRTDLSVALLDHADERGNPILFGTAVVPGAVTIQPRRFTGDNNGNDRLDIGDATVIQRFVASLEPVRPWDVLANDLNDSRSLDSGDVVRVLRAVVGLDPQPRPTGGGASGRGAIQPSGAGGPIQGSPLVAPVFSGPAALLLCEAPRAMPGEQITVRVELAGLGQSISGASFRIEFPAQALRLVEGGVRAGPMVPAGALGVWLADEGSVNAAFSALQVWSTASSRVAEFVFEVLPGVVAQREWTLVLGGAEVTSPDGYTVRPLAGSTLTVGALPVFEPTIGFEPDGRFQVAFSGRAGTSYVIEASTDLRAWTPLDTVHCTGELMRWADSTASAERVRFYRLRQAP